MQSTLTTDKSAAPKSNHLGRGLPPRHYRPELHGVRGLAIVGVVLFHLFGDGRTSGGIDIFLAISGFLFTASLLREATASQGKIDLLAYFSRLARRILAPAVVVVAVTLALGLIILPFTRHAQHVAEARASLLYFENIELINSQLAYGAAGPETSAFQHFWSLSVQGQFYLIWPVLAVIAVFIARRLKAPSVIIMAVLVGAVFIMSLIYAIYMGSFNQDEAYLMTRTRLWELAFGGLLALLGARLTIRRDLRMAAGWLGLGLIVTCGFVLDGAQLFPGPYAFWPLIGLALVLASAGPGGGSMDPPGTASRILSNPLFERIGKYSYGMYLWHWPLLIFYLEIRGREAIGIRGALIVMATTLVLSILTYRFVERPLKTVRSARSSRSADKIIVSLATGILVFGGTATTYQIAVVTQQSAEVFTDWDLETYPGALSTVSEVEVPDTSEILPDLGNLAALQPEYYGWNCRESPSDQSTGEVSVCADPHEPARPSATVVLAGGSHAGQWHPAWQALAENYNWKLLIVDRSGCTFRSTENADSDLCESWNIRFMDWLSGNDVDLVVTPGTTMSQWDNSETIPEGAPDRWEDILDRDASLLLMRGTPRPQGNAADCLAVESDPLACGAPLAQISPNNPLKEIGLSEGISTIDMTDAICPNSQRNDQEFCSGVVGNVAVWYDNSHLTRAFVQTMTPLLESELRKTVPELFERTA